MSVKENNDRYLINPAGLIGLLGLLFLFVVLSSYSVPRHRTKKRGVEDTMTVAAIRPPNNTETFVRVTFLRSQRFYKLSNDADPTYLMLLKASEKDHSLVIIKRARVESDVILSVRKP